MDYIMNPTEVIIAVADAFLVEHKGLETREVLGTVVRSTKEGRIAGGRPGNIWVTVRGEMLNIRLGVSGAGGLGIGFALFANDATEERINRYISYYKGVHETALADWEIEKLTY